MINLLSLAYAEYS